MGRARTRSKVPNRQELETPLGEAFANAVLWVGVQGLAGNGLRRQRGGAEGLALAVAVVTSCSAFEAALLAPAGTPAQDNQDLSRTT